jgi:hypothetical protein
VRACACARVNVGGWVGVGACVRAVWLAFAGLADSAVAAGQTSASIAVVPLDFGSEELDVRALVPVHTKCAGTSTVRALRTKRSIQKVGTCNAIL